MKCNNPNCNCYIFHEDILNRVNDNLISDDQILNISNYFKVISDFTRVKILEAIKDDFLCVCDLGHLLGVTKSAISHQMKVLREYDLVESKREGKMVYYKLKNEFVRNLIKETGDVINA